MARTSDDRNGISCFLVPADTPGLSADPPERKMGLTGSTTATMRFDDVRVPAERRLGAEGDGLCASPSPGSTPAGSASPRSPPASPRARSTHAVAYARERETFGKPIIEHQGLAFLLADMEAAVSSGPRDDAPRRPAARPPACRSPARPRSPSSSPPTTP